MKSIDPDWPVFELHEEDYAGELLREMIPNTDRDGREYEMVTQCLENTDFYQGLCMITVIRRKSDGKLFGYSWWDDISKHGESYMESNGGEFEETDDQDWTDDESWISYYVFEPVEPFTIQAYRKIS